MTAAGNGGPPTDAGASSAAPGAQQHVSVLPSLGFSVDSFRDEIVRVLEFMDRAYREPLE